MNLCKKNLLFRSHPRGLVYATAVSLVLIGRMWTTCKPKPYSSPPPYPLFVSSPWPGTSREPGWGGGGVAVGNLLSPVLRPDSPTALIHQIRQLPLSYLMGHPSLERTPLSEPQSQRYPCLSTTTELGRGGGVSKERRWSLVGERGGQGGKTHVLYLKSLLSEKNFTGPLHLNPTHISFWIAAIINTLVIRSSLKDWQSMKKECTLAWPICVRCCLLKCKFVCVWHWNLTLNDAQITLSVKFSKKLRKKGYFTIKKILFLIVICILKK